MKEMDDGENEHIKEDNGDEGRRWRRMSKRVKRRDGDEGGDGEEEKGKQEVWGIYLEMERMKMRRSD